MKKGEKCEAWVPMELGYGSAARNTEKGIPEADTEMHFVVTMVDFEKIKESYEMNYDEKIEDGQRLKEQGSALLRQGSTKQAVKKYEAALKYFAYEDKTATDEQKKAAAAVRVPCLLNLGNVAAKTSDWEKVFEHANKVGWIWTRAFFRSR
jgi:FK506-binding protein 4/5